jgi:hypothetical protein
MVAETQLPRFSLPPRGVTCTGEVHGVTGAGRRLGRRLGQLHGRAGSRPQQCIPAAPDTASWQATGQRTLRWPRLAGARVCVALRHHPTPAETQAIRVVACR